MLTEAPIQQLSRLHTVSRQLRGLFPRLPRPYGPLEIWVVSSQPRLAERMAEAVRLALGAPLEESRVRLLPQGDSFPDLNRRRGRVHGFWYLFSPDRYEPGSDSFVSWADEHREALRGIPLFAFEIFHRASLADHPARIKAETVQVAERPMVVTPFLLDAHAAPDVGLAAVAALQRQFVTKILFRSLVARLPNASWTRLAEALDAATAAAIEGRLAPVRGGRQRGLNALDTEILNLRYFTVSKALAAEAALYVDEFFDLAAKLKGVDTTFDSISKLSEEVALALNDERLRSSSINRWEPTETVAFTAGFQQFRNRALLVTEKLVKDFSARGLPAEAEKYRAAREELAHDITVILLGAFSSGKSTFLNTLLGLGEGSDPLPTSGKPETATINVLEYGEREGASLKFEKVIELDFFSETRPGRMKINRYEMAAFLKWLADGSFDAQAVEIYRHSAAAPGGAAPAPGGFRDADRQLFRELLDSGRSHEDRGWLAQREAVWRAANIRFRNEPRLPPSEDLGQFLQFVKTGDVALRTESLLLRRSLPVLKGLRFVDTPGTDSLITHHHTLARAYIEEHPGAPIIYLFDGTRAGSIEDIENVSFLRSLGPDSERLFFVITKKQKCVESDLDEAEIRQKVDECLRRAGVAGRRVYFVDSVAAREHPEEPEWSGFIAELKAYVDENRTQLLRAQAVRKVRRPLEALRDEFNKHIADLLSDSQTRTRKMKQLRKRLAAVDEIETEFAPEVRRARKRLYRGPSQEFQREIDDIAEELEGGDWSAWLTSTKDEQLERMRDLVEPLKDWPERLTKNLAKASESLVSFLRGELGRRAGEPEQSITRKDLPPEYRAFGVAAIDEKLDEDKDKRRYVLSYTDWLEEKAQAVRELVVEARSAAVRSTDEKFGEMVSYYEQQISTVRDRLRAVLRSLEDEAHIDAAIDEKRAHVAFIESCLKEIEVIA